MDGLDSRQFSLSVAPAAADQMAGAMTNFPWHAGAAAVTGGVAANAAPAVGSAPVADAHSCGECWRKVLAELLFTYRAAIPNRCVAACLPLPPSFSPRFVLTMGQTDLPLCMRGEGRTASCRLM